MKKLFVVVLIYSCVGISFAVDLQSTSGLTPGQKENSMQLANEPSAQITNSGVKTSAKSALKTLFGGSKMAEGDRIGRPVIERTSVDTDQMQEMIDKLPPSDRKILSAVRTQIATWPKEIFEEISSYREFVINARKVAQQKYDLLSQEAKEALESEKQLKFQLSKDTVQKLEALDASILN